MTGERTTLDMDWQRRQVERQRERVLAGGARYGRRTQPREPDADLRTRCQRCGERVTRRYVQVFGVVEDGVEAVWGCPACYNSAEIVRGATRPGVDGRKRELASDGGGRR